MKRTLALACATLCTLIASTQAAAVQIGPYLGVGAGYGFVKTPNNYAFDTSPDGSNSRDRGGVAWHGFGGYNVNRYAAIEGAYTYYPRSLYVGRLNGAYSSIGYYTRTYTLVAKGFLPLGDTGIDTYLLAGIARVVETIEYENGGIPLSGSIAAPNNGNSHAYQNRPMYGLGISYSFGRRFSANVEWSQIQRLSRNFSSSAYTTPFISLVAFNMAYNFC